VHERAARLRWQRGTALGGAMADDIALASENRVDGGPASAGRPLVLDVDGCLLRTDLLLEMALAYVKPNPLRAVLLLWWLLQGRAFLKRQLASRVQLDVDALPLNAELVAFASAAFTEGRQVVLATASDELAARELARGLPFVTGVIASNGLINLKGARKAKALERLFPEGFDYAGNARSDLAVWRSAAGAIVVGASPAVARAAARATPILLHIRQPARGRVLLECIRPHQWAKNGLVFIPLLLSGRIFDMHATIATAVAFVALSLLASATYIVNDLWDLADDRRHWSKRARPLASGRLPLALGAAVVPLALAAALLLGAAAGGEVLGVLGAYLVTTLAYSFYLKKAPVLDGFVLAMLFTLRLALGTTASQARPSPWLFVFSMFLFASLSFAKRHTEISRVIARGGNRLSGRGYQTVDAPLLLAMGVATGIAAVLIMVLYIIDDAFRQSFYGNVVWLWGFPVILFLFVSRIWLVCHRGDLHDDPVAFALKDRPCLGLLGVLLVCFVFAWVGAP
jgi:4-hydroxybenzoate polyprenyltransferase/phosphoserine phosphatase